MAEASGPTPPLSLSQASRQLGMSGPGAARRLKRLLLTKERRLKRPLMIRTAGAVRPRYRITMATLRERCPELFSRRDRVVESVRGFVEELRDRLDELSARDELLARKLKRLENDLAQRPRTTTNDQNYAIG